MNKTILRNIFLVLLLVVLLIVVLVSTGRSPFGRKESSFAIDGKEDITRIELSGSGNTIELEKRSDGWIVNGKYEARKSGINFITRVLTEMKIKSPVSADLFKSTVSDKHIEPVHVKVFSKGRLLKSFLVYKSANAYGNIMKRSPGAKPFIMSLPGFEGDIGSLFTLHEQYWKPFIIFNLLPSEISSVSLDNLSDPESSFTITNKRNIYTLSVNKEMLTGWDTAQVKRYISYFTWVPFENWATDLSPASKKTIETHDPLFRIGVLKADGSEISLTMWEQADSTGKRNTDRLWAKISGLNDLMVIRYFDIDPVLKKRSYFFNR